MSEKTTATEQAKSQLQQAWNGLIDHLQNAREVIDNPDLFGPESNPRVLAEGYRYLAGFIHHGIERSFHEDANFPAFRNALSVYNKSTIENADAIYFYTAIDGRKHYRITAKVADYQHWCGKPRLKEQAVAPQYLIFETSNGPLSGDSGDLRELAKGFRSSFGTMDSSELKISANGELELLLGPDKPADYNGNFICTVKPANKYSTDNAERYANYISGRQLFYDWQYEEPIELEITCLEHMGDQPTALSPALASEKLENMGSIIEGQMRFWMEFYDKILNANGNFPAEAGEYFFPVNQYNAPNAASGATGGGMSTNIAAGGIFDLAEDEALYVEATFTGSPVYASVHLSNLWGESPDYANHQSSLNLFQMYMGDDGIQRWVIAHKDPGVKNWLDTTGLPKGFIAHRWTYPEFPDKENWPTIKSKKISFDEIASYFPDDMPLLSLEERRKEISIRQRHVKKRFRVF